MAGFILAAAGIAAAIGGAEPEALDPVGKLADAIALTRSCPSVVLNRDIIAMAMTRAGISLGPIAGEIGKRSQSMALAYVHLGRDEVCAIARQRYGAAGQSAAGFLAER